MKDGVTKKEFVKKLEELLLLTRKDIKSLMLDEKAHADYVHVIYSNGKAPQRVNITGDSGIGIILDVAEKVF